MNPLSFIGPIFDAVAKFFGWQSQVQTEMNTPEMKRNAEARKMAEQIDVARATIKKGDLDEIRKMAGE